MKNKNSKNNQSFLLKLASKASQARLAAQYKSTLKKKTAGPAYAWPMGIWFTLFFVVPIIIIVCYSFMKRDTFGGVIHEFSITAYKQMLSKAYAYIFLRTLWTTLVSTAVSILIARLSNPSAFSASSGTFAKSSTTN